MVELRRKAAKKSEERRRGPDIWERSLTYLSLAGWLALVISFFVYGRARPQVQTFFDRFQQVHLRTYWDLAWVRPLLWLLVTGLITALFGLVVNSLRHRRRTDEWRVSLVLLAGLCLLSLLAYLWTF